MLAALAAAGIAGILAAASPKLAMGGLAFAGLVALAIRRPVAHLLLLVCAAVMVPQEILNRFSVGGGLGAAGLQPTDVLVITGCVGLWLRLGEERLERGRAALLAVVVTFLGLALVQVWHGMRAGYGLADAVAEYRVLLGFVAALLALPIVARADGREQLDRGLMVAGLLLGLWGVAQWGLHLQFDDAAAAVRGSRFSTAGRVAGLYGFPVAILLAAAALSSGRVRGALAHMAVVAIIGLNTAALALTFERTFWLAIAAGLLFLVVRAGARQRVRLLVAVPTVAIAVVAVMAVAAPAELEAVHTRLSSLSGYQSDPAVTYRQAESAMVIRRIRAQPVLGAGLGASQLIGRPGTTVQPKPRRYVESGFLWLAWKVGLPLSVLVTGAIALLAVRSTRERDSLSHSVRLGARAGLIALLVSAISFAIFDSIAGTALLGLLMAIAASPPDRDSTAST